MLKYNKNKINLMNHQNFIKRIGKYTLLYIEDDKKIREYIKEFLNHYTKKIYACGSSSEGFSLYKKYKPDILILDINLPDENGIEFATKIREIDKKIRILISTAYTNTEFMLKAIELDITRYLVKPVTNEELFLALERCLNMLDRDTIFYLGDGYSYDRKIKAIINGKEIQSLRRKEADILEFFIEHEREVIRYDILEDSIWSNEVMTRDAIRSQIRNIRKKIGKNCFKNITGIGYKFEVTDEIKGN
jgi:DNA-binding response OmpR family regulator